MASTSHSTSLQFSININQSFKEMAVPYEAPKERSMVEDMCYTSNFQLEETQGADAIDFTHDIKMRIQSFYSILSCSIFFKNALRMIKNFLGSSAKI